MSFKDFYCSDKKGFLYLTFFTLLLDRFVSNNIYYVNLGKLCGIRDLRFCGLVISSHFMLKTGGDFPLYAHRAHNPEVAGSNPSRLLPSYFL